MWILEDVNVPDSLIEAAKADKLVLFVGAGASCGAPSLLPSYKDLATKLAQEQGVAAPTEEEPLDRFISMLPDRKNAHIRALKITGDSTAECNDTHRAIIRLATSVRTPRIVTTNYDLLLEKAAESEHVSFTKKFSAPALPLGDSFNGIVHLHGDCRGEPNEIVLDDKDFGKAYLIQKWASNFLVPLFNTYSVVFIGYSLSDPIMNYLLGGLKSFAQPQFAFIPRNPKNNNTIWEQRGITPITFPLHSETEDNYAKLPQALNALTDHLLENYETYKMRISQIISQDKLPSLPVDIDYLIKALQTEDGAKCFTRLINIHDSAKMTMWVQWILKTKPLSQLLTKDKPDTKAEQLILSWIEHALTLEENYSLLDNIFLTHNSNIGALFLKTVAKLLSIWHQRIASLQ